MRTIWPFAAVPDAGCPRTALYKRPAEPLCTDVAALAPAPLSARFYRRPTDVVARALLGKRLLCGAKAGYIVETEAYLGRDDKASHARFGPTKRNRIMFGPGGFSYVYLCYGIHNMFNIVTETEGRAGAVLVRAVSIDSSDFNLGRGPGKLCRALGIEREDNGLDLTRGSRIYVARGRRVTDDKVCVGPRVGIDYAGSWREAPLRFWIDGDPAVSGRPRSRKSSQR